jgi:hypothetical protein
MLKHISKYSLLCLRIKINIGGMLGCRDFERLEVLIFLMLVTDAGCLQIWEGLSYTVSVHKILRPI